MDVISYKNSGMLQKYVLELLEPSEIFAVEQVLDRYPQLRKEVYEMQVSLQVFIEKTLQIDSSKLYRKIIKENIAAGVICDN